MAATEIKKAITDEQQQELDAGFERAGKALAVIETYDQARIDRLCQAVAWAVATRRALRDWSRWVLPRVVWVMGPMPKEIPYRYSGPARRAVPSGSDASGMRGDD